MRAPTRLLYLEQMHDLQATVHLLEKRTDEQGGTTLLLDATIFYPQGGGQPFDQGTIEASGARFRVDAVRFADGVVLHHGEFENGTIDPGQRVLCRVDRSRRKLHSRIHSAGHVVDMAVHALGYGWTPGKGYHFPQGPYVEYDGTVDDDRDEIVRAIETEANRIIEAGLSTRVEFVDFDRLSELCRSVPDYVPRDKPSRVVLYGDFGVPCGGTHVAALGEIGPVTIRKIKASGETIRVSYAVRNGSE